jgi:hypothetical protein
MGEALKQARKRGKQLDRMPFTRWTAPFASAAAYFVKPSKLVR